MREELKGLQVLRAIGFLMIFTSHANLTSLGGGGVALFLILSGFVMSYRYDGVELKTNVVENFAFMIGRIKKDYLLHLVTFLGATPFMLYLCRLYPTVEQALKTIVSVPLNILMLQSWIPVKDIYYSFNAVSWYLSVYCFCVFVFPTIQKRIRNRSTLISIVSMVVVVLFQAALGVVSTMYFGSINESNGITDWVTYIFPINRFGDFYIGCNLYRVFGLNRENKVIQKSKYIISFFELSSLMLMMIMPRVISTVNCLDKGFWRQALVYEPFAVCLVFLFAVQRGIFSNILVKSNVLCYIGNISRYAFLIHQLVIRYSRAFLKRLYPDNYILLSVLVSLLLTIICCELYKRIQIRLKR